MQRILTIVYFLVSINIAFCQSGKIDVMLQKIAHEKNEDKRIDLINDFLSNTSEINPVLDLKNAQILFVQSQDHMDKVAESMALSQIGYDYRAFGNSTKSLEYALKAAALAEETGIIKLMANTHLNLAHNYKDRADYSKAIAIYMSVVEYASALKDPLLQLWTFNSLGQVYMERNKLDSALMYTQRAYELRNYDSAFLTTVLRYLGGIHGKMRNHSLAISYFDLALKEAFRVNSPRWVNEVHTALAQYYYDIGQNDSSLVFARKAVASVKNTAFSTRSIKPAKLLLDIYKENNSDSALKYSEIYRIANDSLFSIKTIQQTQLMIFEEDLRQQEFASEKLKMEEEREQNIQYALIAVGIITFFLLFLLLSRRIITNTRVIEFFGIIALLIVFEFFNLLSHPFLEKVTHHSPMLMLLALVLIAALLVPLHHRLQKWATHLLVEKNRKIRLAAAKKTIEKLEKNNS